MESKSATDMSESRFLWRARIAKQMPPGQFARYLMVGVWNTVFGYSLYAVFTALLMPRVRFGYIYASVASNLLAITVAYFCYKIFIFKTQGNYLAEWLRCILVYGSALLPGLVLLPLLVEGLHSGFHLGQSAPYVAGALVMGLTVIYSFLGHKNFSFRVPDKIAQEVTTIEDVEECAMAEPATKAARRV
jgi:putative flippase GtrA